MIEYLGFVGHGLALLSHPQTLMFLFLGVSAGMLFGLIPGLSGLTGMSLLLPIAITQPTEPALAFLLGMYAVTTQTDAIPAVLIGVPGTAAAQATYLDGYPMAKRGEASRALSASYYASIWGTIVASVVIVALLPLLRLLIHSFAAPEFLLTSVIGLILASSLVGTSMIRGLTAAVLGLVLASVGFAAFDAAARFTSDISYLEDGLSIVPIALGLFALPEALDLLLKRRPIAANASELSERAGFLDGFTDTIRHKWLVFRTGIIGCVAGMVPGLGGSVAEWLSYGHAVHSAKDASQFGKGDVRGVIAPESGTAAQKPGALVPTLVLGIPGNPAMAVLMGALLIVGVSPGPAMLNEHLDLTFMMVWIVVISNIIVAALCIWLQRWLVKICFVSPDLLGPLIFCFMLVGAALSTNTFGDIIVFGIFGFIGYVFKHADWPRVPMLIGLVLGHLVEKNLWISYRRYDFAFLWERPIVIAMEIVALFILVGVIRSRKRLREHSGPAEIVQGD